MFILKSFVSISVATVLMSSAYAQVKPDISASNPTAMELKARKLYERLTGTKIPVDSPEIKKMVELMAQGNLKGAASIATSDPNFYNITVKLMALELSTREETIKTPFNDFAASFIGVTRDQTDARELLTGNFYYRGKGDLTVAQIINDILTTNNHYSNLEARRANLFEDLIRVEGQVLASNQNTVVPNPDPGGVLTSRAFMGAHALMGTNRRLVEFTFREFMCVPLEKWADTGASDLRIGRDIDRFPANDHIKFQTSCKGCHTVMDGFRGAFAKWQFETRGLKHADVNQRGTGNVNNFAISVGSAADGAQGVVSKFNQNGDVYPAGYVTRDDSFVNNATRAANASLFGWRSAGGEELPSRGLASVNPSELPSDILKGNGVKDFGKLVANSRRFSQCMAQHVFKTVCRKEVDPIKQKTQLKQWGDEFEASGYKLKALFENISTKSECLSN